MLTISHRIIYCIHTCIELFDPILSKNVIHYNASKKLTQSNLIYQTSIYLKKFHSTLNVIVLSQKSLTILKSICIEVGLYTTNSTSPLKFDIPRLDCILLLYIYIYIYIDKAIY